MPAFTAHLLNEVQRIPATSRKGNNSNTWRQLISEPQLKARRADMEMGAERSEAGEPQPKARRADMEMGAERSEAGEPQPKARRADMEMGAERSEAGLPGLGP